jgi:hypothetical protein
VTQSLFVAEKLLSNAAREFGVPVRVYRSGFVGWHSRTRAVDRNGYLVRLLQQMAFSGELLYRACFTPSSRLAVFSLFAESFPALPPRQFNDIEVCLLL